VDNVFFKHVFEKMNQNKSGYFFISKFAL